MKKLIIASQDHLRIVPHGDIAFFKSDNCYTFAHLINGEKLVICKSLSLLSKELDTVDFIRVNQSYLLNRNYIRLIDKKNKRLELINKQTIPFTTTLKQLVTLINENAIVFS